MFNSPLPLSEALRDGREFDAMVVLRAHCERLAPDGLRGKDVQALLGELRTASVELERLMRPDANRSIRDVLLHIRDNRLVPLDPRVLAYLDQQLPPADDDAEPDEEEIGKEVASMEAFLACPASQLLGLFDLSQGRVTLFDATGNQGCGICEGLGCPRR